MSLFKRLILVVAIFLLFFLAYKIWQPSQAQYEDYRALLCYVIQNETLIDKDQIIREMEKVQKHSYPDYALQKPTFKPRFAQKVFSQFNDLKPLDQAQARHSIQACETLISW